MPPDDSSGFQDARLDRLLRARIPGLQGDMRIEPVAGGRSNPTYFVSYRNRDLVLRKKPSGLVLDSAHAIDREYRILRALEGSDVPVPAVHFFEEDPALVGTAFYVMDRVEGRVFDDPTLPSVSCADRHRMILASAEVLGRLHGLPWSSLGLADFGREGNFYARQIARWTRQWNQSRELDIPEIDRLADWLGAHIPDTPGTGIVHGDFRLNNLVFHPSEPEVVAVLDWELCTIGHPLADVAYFSLLWKLDSSESLGFRDHDLRGLHIPTEDEWLAHYRSFAPSHEPLLPFHSAFALFRLAVIAQGVAHRASQGNASSADAAQFGELGPAFARRGLEILEQT